MRAKHGQTCLDWRIIRFRRTGRDQNRQPCEGDRAFAVFASQSFDVNCTQVCVWVLYMPHPSGFRHGGFRQETGSDVTAHRIGFREDVELAVGADLTDQDLLGHVACDQHFHRVLERRPACPVMPDSECRTPILIGQSCASAAVRDARRVAVAKPVSELRDVIIFIPWRCGGSGVPGRFVRLIAPPVYPPPRFCCAGPALA